jgi:hypothetical protein
MTDYRHRIKIMIHRDWNDKLLRFQLEVGRLLAQVRQESEISNSLAKDTTS